jgi:CRISPR-associated endonuclease/helicase Cas3
MARPGSIAKGAGAGARADPCAHAAQGGARRHLLRDHLGGTGELAAVFASAFGAESWGRAAGRLHDLGKFAAHFQAMLASAAGYEVHLEGDDLDGPRDHSSAGAIHAIDRLGGSEGLALALLVAGHHGGLPAAADLVKRRIPHKRRERCLGRALEGGARPEDLAIPELRVPDAFADPRTPGAPHRFEMWVRMLFSCLCDADFLDTEAFYGPEKAQARDGAPDVGELAVTLGAHLDHKSASAPATEVNHVRREVLEACRSAAASEPGFFSLTVPTGGGKTLASLAFALDHARAHALRRVIVAIPFTSIIEQSAAVYRGALGREVVLEHHTARDPAGDSQALRLAAENWDSPIVVTTTVQLFESLFANRPARCRKLHRLAGSVIVLDEAQSLPPAMLAPLLDGLRSLVTDFRCSLVISTATQPAFGADLLEGGIEGIREIVPSGARLFERLRRVRVKWPSAAEPLSWGELAASIAEHPDVLAIVHRRADAQLLTRALDALTGDASTFHLSALMCPAHRSSLISAIKDRKRHGLPVRLVATQLVEAGVDLDFAVVYRAMAGLDSLAQAAGRCNREGRLEGLGELRVFVAPTVPPRGVPATGLAIASGLLEARPDLDLFAPSVHGTYFERLYGARDLDARGVQELRRKLDFPAVAAGFSLIEDGWSEPVVAPYGEAARLLGDLARSQTRDALRGLQRFTVNVRAADRERWVATGAAREVAGLVVAVEGSAAYDERFGLDMQRVGAVDPESLVA